MSLDRIDAETLGRTAAHQGLNEAQIEAVMTCLGVTPGSNLIHRAIRAYRKRLIWIAEGMGVNEADPNVTDAELNAALGHPTSYLDI